MMKKRLTLLFAAGLLGCGICSAQEGYTVSGKLRGVNTPKVHLLSADFGRVDTLASAAVQNETFVLSGNVPGGVRAAKLVLEGVEGELAILLENIPYQISITQQGAIIEGEGPAAELLKSFEQIGRDYVTEQNRMAAEAEGADAAKVQGLQLRLDQAYKTSVERTCALIKANADSYVSAYVIALGITADDEATLQAKYNLLSESAKATAPGKEVAAALDRYVQLSEGREAPDFALTKPDGNKFSLYGLKTKWKLVCFWSSTNAASRQENTDLVRLYLQFRPKGLEIVSVSLDTDAVVWKKAVGLDGMTWTNVSDLQGFDSEVVRLYQVHELPCNFLLDAENRIVARNLHGADLRARLTELTRKQKKQRE